MNTNKIREFITEEIMRNKNIKEMFETLLHNKIGAMTRYIDEYLEAQQDEGLRKAFLNYSSGDLEYVRSTYDNLIKQKLKEVLEKSLNGKIPDEEFKLAYLEARDDVIEREKAKSVIKLEKPEVEKAEYEIWDIKGNRSSSKKMAEDLRNQNRKSKLDIFIDEDGTAYFKGKKVIELKKSQILYNFLLYFLKNKGVGGTYENLFLEVWPVGKEKKSKGHFEVTKSQKANVIRMKNRLNGLIKDYGIKEINYEYNKYRLDEDCDFCLIQRNTG